MALSTLGIEGRAITAEDDDQVGIVEEDDRAVIVVGNEVLAVSADTVHCDNMVEDKYLAAVLEGKTLDVLTEAVCWVIAFDDASRIIVAILSCGSPRAIIYSTLGCIGTIATMTPLALYHPLVSSNSLQQKSSKHSTS